MEESVGFNQLEIVGDLSAIPLARGGHSQFGGGRESFDCSFKKSRYKGNGERNLARE